MAKHFHEFKSKGGNAQILEIPFMDMEKKMEHEKEKTQICENSWIIK